jgi:hypothetical protein
MYLISKDYQRIIQTSELNAITSNDISIRVLVEGSVQSEVYAWLKQRFDLDSEFTSTDAYSNQLIYKANQRIYLDATAYNPASTFVLNSLTLINGLVYYCSTAIVVPEVFNGANWTLLGTQYDLFFVTPPEQLFDEMTVYKVGDKVFWRNKVYTSLKDSVREDQQNALQASSIESIGLGNVLPDDRTNGLSFWGVGIAYSVAVGTYPIDITKWTKGDNRNQMFVTIIMVIVVYNLCSRIAPNNVPEARHNAWVKALKDIKDMASGDINAQLPIIQPAIGNRIQFGGDQRQINSW